MNFVNVISSEINDLSQRIIKYLRLGLSDVQTSVEAMPYGTDAMPIKDIVAVYAQTEEKGKTVIVGYINLNQKSNIGEHRIYSTDENGNLSNFIHLKNDGTMEVGGNSDFMVRFLALDTGILDFQSQIQAELVKIATGIASAGGSYTPGTLNVDISNAKIDEIKTTEN